MVEEGQFLGGKNLDASRREIFDNNVVSFRIIFIQTRGKTDIRAVIEALLAKMCVQPLFSFPVA